MKKNLVFKTLLLALVVVFNSCSSDSNDDTDGDGSQITSLTISRQFTTDVYAGGNVYFNVIDNNNQNVTSSSTITVNGTPISNNSYTTVAPGTLDFIATKNGIVSNTLQIDVLEPPTKFSKNVLIEDYTGTWCGWCPRVSYGIEQVNLQTNKAVTVAIHRYGTNPSGNGYDPYTFDAQVLENSINLQGYPTAMLDRTTEWTYPEPSNVNQVVSISNTDADLGLALTPTISGGNISVEVNVKFGDLSSNNAKLVVYILEDDLIHDQENYTSYYGGVSVISNFEHDHVLRASLTSLLGDTIPSDQVVENNTYTQTISVAVPSNVVNTSKMSVVAFVVDGNTRAVYNVRSANFGDTQTIEEL